MKKIVFILCLLAANICWGQDTVRFADPRFWFPYICESGVWGGEECYNFGTYRNATHYENLYGTRENHEPRTLYGFAIIAAGYTNPDWYVDFKLYEDVEGDYLTAVLRDSVRIDAALTDQAMLRCDKKYRRVDTEGGYASHLDSILEFWFDEPVTVNHPIIYTLRRPYQEKSPWTDPQPGTFVNFFKNIVDFNEPDVDRYYLSWEHTADPYAPPRVWTFDTFYNHYRRPIILFMTYNPNDTLAPCACEDPTGLSLLGKDSVSVLLRWQASPAHVAWQTGYCLADEDFASTATVVQHSCTDSVALQGLAPATRYQFRVRGMCLHADSIYYSDWSQPLVAETDSLASPTPPDPPHQGISQPSEAGYRLVPNPTQGLVQVQGEGIRSITLLDIHGKPLLTTDRPRLDTSTLPSGTYLLLIATPTGTIAQKLVVEH